MGFLKDHWSELLTVFFTAVIAATGLSAYRLAATQLAQDKDEAQVSRLLGLEKEYEAQPLVSYRKTYAQQRLKAVEDPDEEFRLLDFFETVGLLVEHKELNERDVWEEFSHDIFNLYADTRPEIEQLEKDDPAEYDNVVSLEERMRVIEKEHHTSGDVPSKADLKDHWEDEATLIAGVPTIHHKKVATKP